MPRRRKFKYRALTLGISIAALIVLVFAFTRPREPSFNGVPACVWTHQVNVADPEGAAVRALLAIGPPAVPFIFREYEGAGTALQRSPWYKTVQTNFPAIARKVLPPPTAARTESSKAGLIFVLTRIRPAPPQLEKFLLRELRSDSASVQFYACDALRITGCSAPGAGRQIARLLQHTDPSARSCALKTLIELRKLEPGMVPQLENLARQQGAAWTDEIRGIALYALWLLRAPGAEANLRNLFVTGSLQEIQWPVSHLNLDPAAATTFLPDLSRRADQTAGSSSSEFLKEAIAQIPPTPSP
jgi:hypothetical protein